MPKYYSFEYISEHISHNSSKVAYYLFKQNNLGKCGDCFKQKQIYKCIFRFTATKKQEIYPTTIRIFCKKCLISAYHPKIYDAKSDDRAIEIYKREIIMAEL